MRPLKHPSFRSVSAASSVAGATLSGALMTRASVQGQASGLAGSGGHVKLQFSNDMPGVTAIGAESFRSLFEPTNWNDIPGAIVQIDSDGSFVIPDTELTYDFIRAYFDHGSLTAGTISAIVEMKGWN